MRRPLTKSLLLLLPALAVLGLAACDTTGEQPIEWEPGDDLAIVRSTDVAPGDLPNDQLAPGTSYFYVQAHNRNWDYTWNVSPDVPSEVLQEGQFFRIETAEPGTYTVTVQTTIEGETYDDTLAATVDTATAGQQIARLSQFSTLNTALGAVGLADTLAMDTTEAGADVALTALAPTNEALLAKFDADGEDGVEADELPADSVLADILETHIIPQTVTPDEIRGGATFTTLEGEEVTFQGSGDDLSVVVEDMGEVIAEAPVTLASYPVANGAVYPIGGVLVPGSAEVQFNDQTAVDTVNVASVYVPQDGYVAVHDSTLLGPDGEAFTPDDQPVTSVIGVSEYLTAGVKNDVQVALFRDVPGGVYTKDSLQTDQTLIAMPHEETSGNEQYDYITTGGTMDGPYTENGHAVIDPAAITVPEE